MKFPFLTYGCSNGNLLQATVKILVTSLTRLFTTYERGFGWAQKCMHRGEVGGVGNQWAFKQIFEK